MKQHFIGNVYRFEKQPDQWIYLLIFHFSIKIMRLFRDISCIEENELENNSKERLKNFKDLPVELQEVVKKNSGINIEGQLKIVEEVESNLEACQQLLNWKSYPDYPQLKYVIELCWKYLLN
ncbi:MAG: hypothetical protein V8Q31_09000 [Alistipes communis]